MTVGAGLLLITLDNSILYTALPTLTADLGASGSSTLWIINAYPWSWLASSWEQAHWAIASATAECSSSACGSSVPHHWQRHSRPTLPS